MSLAAGSRLGPYEIGAPLGPQPREDQELRSHRNAFRLLLP